MSLLTEFHQTGEHVALLLSPVWQSRVTLGRAGLGTVHGGTDGLACDLVGGPEPSASRDTGS